MQDFSAGFLYLSFGGHMCGILPFGWQCPLWASRSNGVKSNDPSHGTNVLAGISKEDIIHHAFRQLRRPVQPRKPPLWDGEAGKRTIEILTCYLNEHE